MEPLEVVLELVRGDDAGKPALPATGGERRSTRQTYLLRDGEGHYLSAPFIWDQETQEDLAQLGRENPDLETLERLGKKLDALMTALGWEGYARLIQQALVEQQRPVHLVFRLAANELLGLPHILLSVGSTRLAEHPNCFIRYECSNAPLPTEKTPPPEGGRILFAWSDASADVPADHHLLALSAACDKHQSAFEPEVSRSLFPPENQLAHASLDSLRQSLAQGQPVAALHILCHGRLGPDKKTFGLVLDPDPDDVMKGKRDRWVGPGELEEFLRPHAGRIRLVVLCACDSGNAGSLDNQLGSVAQAVHRAGIPAVIASRLPLSQPGSVVMTEELYGQLLSGKSLQAALRATQARLEELGRKEQQATKKEFGLDWLSLQLYARLPPGTVEQYPFVFRPYRGLRAFETRNARFFFGREKEIRTLVDRVYEALIGQRPRFQVVAGASGTGKSSLVLAGLVPMLAQEDWDVLALRPCGREQGGLAELRRSLRGLLAQEPDSVPATEDSVLEAARLVRDARPKRKLLLVVDQFEEIFSRLADGERESFCRALWRMTHVDALDIVVVATLRVDYFSRADSVRLDANVRLDAVLCDEAFRLFIAQLQPAQILEAIRGPAQQVGLVLGDGLAELMRDEVGAEPGALPLLQHALDTLWVQRQENRLTHEAYLELGKVAGALSRNLDGFFKELTPGQQKQARRLLVSLVDFEDETAPYTRRRVWLAKARPLGERAGKDFDAVLEQLVAARLLVRGDVSTVSVERNGGWIEIAHESLIRRWDLLQRWLAEDRERERQLRELDALAEAWQAHRNDDDGDAEYLPKGNRLGYVRNIQDKFPEDLSAAAREFVQAANRRERRRQWRQRLIIGGLAVAAFLFAYLAHEAVSQRDMAQRRLTEALDVANEVLHVVDRELMSVGGAGSVRKKLLDRVVKLQEGLLEGAPDSSDVVNRGRSESYLQRGEVALFHDDLGVAYKQYAAAMELAQQLVRRMPGDIDLKRDIAFIYYRLGQVAQSEGNLADARAALEQSLALRKALSEANPSDPYLEWDLNMSYGEMVVEARKEGNMAEAYAALEQNLALSQRLAGTYPLNEDFARELSLTYVRMGDLASEEGMLADAHEAFERALSLSKTLSEADGSNAVFKQDLAFRYHRLGMVERKEWHLADARTAIEQSIKLTKALAAVDSSNTELTRNLCACYEGLSEIAIAEGKLADARLANEEYFKLAKALVESDPSDARFKSDLAVGYSNLSFVAQMEGKLADARAASEQSLLLLKALVKANPSNHKLQLDEVASEAFLAQLVLRMRDTAAFQSHRDAALLALENVSQRSSARYRFLKKFVSNLKVEASLQEYGITVETIGETTRDSAIQELQMSQALERLRQSVESLSQ